MQLVLDFILDEGKWIATAMLLSGVLVGVQARRRGSLLESRLWILWALNAYYSTTIAILAFGHVLAVTIRFFQGSLRGSPWQMYLIGVALAVPSWWMMLRVGSYVGNENRWRRRMTLLNGGLGAVLMVTGLHNLPLVLPAILNLAYQHSSRPAIRRIIVGLNLTIVVLLFLGALIFMANGRSFEEFRGM
jgi:hypothetical protein